MKKARGLKGWHIASLVWLSVVTALYIWPSDAFYAITIWPPFVWASLAVVLSLFGIRKHRSKLQGIAIAGWVLFGLIFGEEWRWIPRQFSLPKGEAGQIHVVSLNCAGGDPYAAQEAMESNPDIVLLQESPSRGDIEQAAKLRSVPMSVLAGVDASIVTTGKLEPVAIPRGTHNFVAAIVSLPNQEPIFVVSLRLQPPVFSLEYWNPDCWRTYAENRSSRRKELKELVEWIRQQAGNLRIIVGGDFNTPPDNGTFHDLSAVTVCATPDSGYTAVNEFPMARIDQVWTRGFGRHASYALMTKNSDHRMVRLWINP